VGVRELSLFSGAGGGVLGSKILGWETIGYVEWEDYCQKIIAQRIKDGIFDNAPIFGDIRTFLSEGYARRYRGLAQIVTGGFPCQPFSVAGKREASNDPRNMWEPTMEVIKAVQPPIVFLENVPGLLSATVDNGAGRSIHYFGTILRDLAESGYDVKWCVLGADDVGAPHHRKRLWILGVHTDSEYNGSFTSEERGSDGAPILNEQEGENSTRKLEGVDTPKYVAHTKSLRPKSICDRKRNKIEKKEGLRFEPPSGGESHNVPDTNSSRQSGSWWAFDPSDSQKERERQEHRVEHDCRWGVESHVGRVADGVADRSYRLKAIGNGQVPIAMATAYAILSNEFIGELE